MDTLSRRAACENKRFYTFEMLLSLFASILASSRELDQNRASVGITCRVCCRDPYRITKGRWGLGKVHMHENMCGINMILSFVTKSGELNGSNWHWTWCITLEKQNYIFLDHAQSICYISVPSSTVIKHKVMWNGYMKLKNHRVKCSSHVMFVTFCKYFPSRNLF